MCDTCAGCVVHVFRRVHGVVACMVCDLLLRDYADMQNHGHQ